MVPVHLDALHCPNDRVVVQATADFARLPFRDGTRDLNSDVAQISEEIVARPFQDETSVLRAGVHLHWALPDALTRGRHRRTENGSGDHRTRFPAVPNRWLVRRGFAKGSPESLAPRAWVVESDYLHPDGIGETMGVAVPFPSDPAGGRYRPFRYLGRVQPLELWHEGDPAAGYVRTLSAVGFELADGGGYSDPAFAALYPNCHSVFGFHDSEVGGQLPAGLRYDLIGWYADPATDFLPTVIAEAKPDDSLRAVLERYAAWTFSAPDAEEFPVRLACYASLGFVPPAAPGPVEPTVVTLGNTGTEALSVALAARIDRALRFQIEDQLEAIQLAPRLEHHLVDTGARFHEIRHEKGFTAHRGDVLWTIGPVGTSPVPLPADAARAQAQAQVELPPELAGLLGRLNEAQQARDRAATELETLRRQLFADWYKYLLCAYPPEDTGDDYPDIDEVRAFLETKSLPRVLELAGAIEPTPDTPESRLRAAHAAVSQALDALNQREQLRASKLSYELKPLVAPRFWQPTDPVVLFTGDDARATERHGRDGRLRDDALLACYPVPVTAVTDVIGGDLPALTVLIDDLRQREAAQPVGQGGGSVAFRDSDGSPWNPFQLEWEVELFPLRNQGNLHPEADSYGTGFITANYALTAQDPDLVLTADQTLAGAAAVYSGANFLTWHAGERLRRSLTEYLRKEILPEFNEANEGPAATDPGPVIEALRSWYEQTFSSTLDTPEARAADPVYLAIRGYQELLGMNYLAQSLGGFNDALLMHRTVKQLPIDDPLGFDDDRAFAGAVRAAVGTSNRSAPEPLNDFSPIRSGALRLLRLRLVDTFGQTRDVRVEDALPAEALTIPDNPNLICLPPRLSQPARVVFRWLDADRNLETSVHPDTSPICGWLLPNHVDTSLMIYDGDGRALGAIDALARWQPAPGGTGVPTPPDIDNPYLSRTVADILGHGPEFLTQLMGALDSALENIEPEGVDAHVDLAVLIGRPIALVRAALDLELLGLPAVHQGWNQFRQDMARSTRDSDGFTRVVFPLRLGAYQQLDDGLIGYWLGEESTFYSPQGESFPHPAIRTYADGPLQVPHAVDDPSQVVRLLVDPRGKVHVTSGIQPVKTISIPPPHYVPALSKIEVTFPCAPLLTDRGAVNLPLPIEPGYRWTWVDEEDGAWAEVSDAPTIGRGTFVDTMATRLWEHLIDPHIAWLQPVPGATGQIRAVDPDERAAVQLDPPFRAMTDRVEDILAPLGDHLVQRQETTGRLAETIAAPAWNRLLRTETGWLAAITGTVSRALVTARDSRAQPVLTAELAGAEPLIDSILDLGEERIGPVSSVASFAAAQELRGGWLKLRPEESAD